MKKLVLHLLILFIFTSPSHAFEKIDVIATVFPLADIVKSIGNDYVNVMTILPPGASPHTFEPKPKDIIKYKKAKLIIIVGAGLDFWVEKMVEKDEKQIVLRLSDFIELSKYDDNSHHHYEHNKNDKHKYKRELKQEDHQEHEMEYDPHFFLDPILMIDAAKIITAKLSQIRFELSNYFNESFKNYKLKLIELDNLYKISLVQFKNKKLITFHNAWGYLARRYGLIVEEVIIEAPGKEPSPRKIKNLLDKLKKMNISTIFVEPQFNTKNIEAIAKDMHVQLVTLDPIGGVVDRDSYIKLMTFNLYQLVKGLQ